MKAKFISIVTGALMAWPAFGTLVPIGNSSFEGVNGTISSPTGLGLGVNSGTLGVWLVEAGGLIGLQTSVRSGTGLGGPTPTSGTYDVRISTPLGVGSYASLSQTLSVTLDPVSVYVLSMQIDAGTVVGLLGHSSLQLKVGGTTVASLSNGSLAALVDSFSGFQTISLTYQTGATPPSGNIGIFFETDSVAGLGGNIWVDNFQLNVSPAPEPVTWALLIFFGMFTAWLAYRALKSTLPIIRIRILKKRSTLPDSLHLNRDGQIGFSHL